MPVSLSGLGMIAGGLVLVYTGVNDVDGGPVGAVRELLSGRVPTPGAQTRTAVNETDQAGRSIGEALGSAGAALATGGAALAAGTSANRQKIIATAQSYLGVPYRFGGLSRSGIDCSGLVLRAYESIGVKLPHKASLQAAKGRRISRSDIKPGDLVAWGAPGNYPHIALAMNADQVIVAPHTGSKVMYQKLWEKKVGGFGFPDIIRILGD